MPRAARRQKPTFKSARQRIVEAWAAEAHRLGRFSAAKLAGLLAMDRLALTRLLGEARVYSGTTAEETAANSAALDRLPGPAQG